MTLPRPVLLPAVLAALAVLAVLAGAAPASANYRVGIGDQSPTVFDQPAFQALYLKRTRYLLPWDWYRAEHQRFETRDFMVKARQAGYEVLVTFTAKRGCWNGGRYSRSKACRAPSTRALRSSFRRFRTAYPHARLFAAWNEANHASQPTYRSPKLAAAYYNALRAACGRCRIMAADVLDSSNVRTWLRTFLRHARRSPRLWGIHNYADVNRRRSSGTVAVLKTVPGEVWMTETGGIVSFGRAFRYSPSRAAARTRTMFALADRFDTRLRGHRSRITRVYIYSWFGRPRGTVFDAGLTNADGTLRPAYRIVAATVKRRLK